MTPEEYSALDAMNWSTLKSLAVSPKLFAHRRDNPQPDKPTFELGRAIHCAVLEPDRWRQEYAPTPDFGDGRMKAAKELKAEWFAALGSRTAPVRVAERSRVRTRRVDGRRTECAAGTAMTTPANNNAATPATLLDLLKLSCSIEQVFGRTAAAAVFRLLRPMVPRVEIKR